MISPVQDLAELAPATPDDLARFMREQAAICMPFVRVGPRALAVLNIPQSLVFDERVSANYGTGSPPPPAAPPSAVSQPKPVVTHSQPPVALLAAAANPPHVYEIATKAFVHMMAKRIDQAIVLSGDAASGKSQCARMIAKHLCSLSLNANKKSRVISGVNKMETVLDAFAASFTPFDPTTPRFGRYTEYQFDERGKMVGVKLLDYLFDKERVAAVAPNERNFNVFYMLLAGAADQERAEWGLADASSFAFLNRVPHAAGPTAAALRERFDELRAHLKSLGIGVRTQSMLFRTVVAILLLGELEFDDSDGGSDEPCVVRNRGVLAHIADLLGVSPENLEYALTFQTKLVYREICTVLLSPDGAKLQRNELAKTLYSLLFRWLIEHLNTRLCVDQPDRCVGVLDFGPFVPSEERTGGFETFMTNIANERLAAYMFRSSGSWLQQLASEGVVSIDGLQLEQLTRIPFNASELVWSVGTSGLLSIVNTESQRLVPDMAKLEVRTSQKMHDTCSASPLYSPGTSSARTEFKIKHYAGTVTYNFTGFIERNRAMISPDVVNLFRGSAASDIPASTNLFVRNLFSEINVATSKLTRSNDLISSGYQSGIPQRRASTLIRRQSVKASAGLPPSALLEEGEAVQGAAAGDKSMALAADHAGDEMTAKRRARASMFVATGGGTLPKFPIRTVDLDAALTELEETLDATGLWSILCIAPSRTIGPADVWYMSQQISTLDLPRLAAISKASATFAHCYAFDDFVDAFRPVVVQFVSESDPSEYTSEMLCDAAVSALAMQGERGIRLGTSHIFLSDDVWSKFEAARTLGGSYPVGSAALRASQLGVDRRPGMRFSARTSASGGSSGGRDDVAPYGSGPAAGPPRRPPSPAFTTDASNMDEVSFVFSNEPDAAFTAARAPGTEETGAEKPKEPEPRKKMSSQRCRWLCCTWLLTWWIPSFVLSLCCRMRHRDVRMAWREKVALCIIIFFMCCALLFFIIGLGRLVCPKQEVISTFEIASRSSTKDPWVYMRGRAYQISDIISGHQTSYGIPNFRFAGFLGTDVSSLFYPGRQFAQYCPGLAPPQAGWDPMISRPKADANNYAHVATDPNTGNQKLYLEYMNKFARARIAFTLDFIAKTASTEKRLIVIHNNVYDVSGYFNADSKFFGPLMEQLFGNFYGRDASQQWEQIQKADSNAPKYLECMNNMFYIGTVDHRNDFRCQLSNYMLLATSIVLVAIVGFKFLAALRFGSARDPEFNDKFVICQVPCYTEGADSLLRTLESLAIMQYDDRRKLLFVIADGMIIGSGNDRPTPQIVLDLLGVDPAASADTEPLSFQSLGEGDMQHNMGKVYSGLYQVQGHSVPFVVVVKVGKPSERVKPGNRGKRDSQLILMRFLNRVHFNAPMSPLELEIFHHMKNIIGVHPSFYEYVLMVDADTEVMPDSLNKLVSTMMHDSKIMALCGETLLSNEKDSWITMIQVYEYFISHHLSKAFESLFGSVTCLPGCFSMYRIRSPVKSVPLLVAPGIINDYSENNVDTLHLKNLLHLGEDRYLTTLMMKHFPHLKLSFNPEAQCRTNAPDRWKVLLSQRRRWINSTVHNLIELLSLEQMCGVCCFSMRFIVFMDLFSTVVQPAGVLYIVYLIYSIATATDVFPTISIVMIAAIYGFQVIIFVLKRQWAQIGWMIVYILATPVFSFYIPLYAFWHFDDFSWGNTRVAMGEKAGGAKNAIKEFDPSAIPLRRWVDGDMDKWEGQSQVSGGSRGSQQPESKASTTGAKRSYGLRLAIPGYNKPGGGLGGGAGVLASGAGYGELNSASPINSPVALRSAGISSYFASLARHHGMVRSGASSPAGDQAPIALQPMTPMAPAAAAMQPVRAPSDQEIIDELRAVLSTVDLMSVTKRQVRDQVGRRLGVDLTARRDDVNAFMDQILQGRL
nr:hypothetical protein HK105_007172 [Polyrhizophydium stewartii]